MEKKRLKFLLGLALAAVSLWLSFRKIPLGELWESLKQANYWWLIPSMGFVVLSMIFRSLRWQCLLGPLKRVGFTDLFSAINICFMANNILPARMGEFIRTVLVGKKHKISISSTLATVVLERIFDMMCVMAIFIALLFIHPFEENIRTAGLVLTVIYIAGLLFLVIARIYSKPVSRLIHRMLSTFSNKFAKKACGVIDSFFDGLDVLSDWKQVMLIIFYTVCVWATIVMTYYFICLTMAVDLPAYGYLLIVVFLAVAVMFPSPGYLGTFHLAFKKALVIFGYSPATALSSAIIAHASQWIFIAIIGIACLWRENISFGQLREEEQEAEEEIEHLKADGDAPGEN